MACSVLGSVRELKLMMREMTWSLPRLASLFFMTFVSPVRNVPTNKTGSRSST